MFMFQLKKGTHHAHNCAHALNSHHCYVTRPVKRVIETKVVNKLACVQHMTAYQWMQKWVYSKISRHALYTCQNVALHQWLQDSSKFRLYLPSNSLWMHLLNQSHLTLVFPVITPDLTAATGTILFLSPCIFTLRDFSFFPSVLFIHHKPFFLPQGYAAHFTSSSSSCLIQTVILYNTVIPLTLCSLTLMQTDPGTVSSSHPSSLSCISTRFV